MKKVFFIAVTTVMLSSTAYADKYSNIREVCVGIEGDVVMNVNQLHDIHLASKSKYYNALQGSAEQRELMAALDWLSVMYERLGCDRFGGL